MSLTHQGFSNPGWRWLKARLWGLEHAFERAKARGKAEAAAWLKERGAEPGKTDAYCRIGREEIGKGSLVGSLLRSTE